MLNQVKEILKGLASLSLEDRIETINQIKMELHQYSPFKGEPIDCVLWVPNTKVTANDYNPNSVAPPEMKLLETSILQDGYTQPMVTWFRDGIYEIVDGFHRHRVGKESKEVRTRIHGYLPLTIINAEREDLGDRMASTIRHNRARGKHSVDHMSDIVIELKKRNRNDEWIAKNLGMDQDEVLRLCQISGLTAAFENAEFSKSWDVGHFDDEKMDGQLDIETESEET